VYFYSPAALLVNSSQPAALAPGARVQVLPGGQRPITIAGKGVIAWTQEMSKYRGQVGEITEVEKVLDTETVFRLSVDNGQHEWHRNWVRLYT